MNGLRQAWAGSLNTASLRNALERRSAQAILIPLSSAIASRLGLLAMAILVSRQLGPAGYGVFNFATGLAMFGAQVVSFGWPNLMTRLIPQFRAQKRWDLLAGVLRAGAWTVLLASTVAAVLLLAVTPLFPKLTDGLRLAAILLPPMALVILRRQQLAAIGRAGLGLFFDQGFGALTVSLFILLFGAVSIASLISLYAAAIVFGVVVSTIIFRKSLPSEIHGSEVHYRYGSWMAIAVPIMIGLASRQMLFRTDVLLLAPLSTIDQVGLYGAAFRLTYILTFPQAVMMLVIAPRFAEAHGRGQVRRLRRLLRTSYALAAATSLPFVALLALFPEKAMTTIYGEAFAEGAPILIFLVLGQFAASLSIPTQSLLTMGGKEKVFAGLNLLGFAINAALCLYLIPEYGGLGAAICTGVSACLQFIAQLVIARRMFSDIGEMPEPSEKFG